jgi:hypothetical protein
MSFLLPLGELVIEGIESGAAANMGKEIYNQFAPKIKEGVMNLASDFVGRNVGDFIQKHPNTFISNTLEKSYKHSYKSRIKTYNGHGHKRTGYRRTR